MSKEIDYDNMSDEQIDEILSQIDSGTFENSEPENGNDFNQNEDDNNSNSNSFNEEEEEEDENLKMETLRTQRMVNQKITMLTRMRIMTI